MQVGDLWNFIHFWSTRKSLNKTSKAWTPIMPSMGVPSGKRLHNELENHHAING